MSAEKRAARPLQPGVTALVAIGLFAGIVLHDRWLADSARDAARVWVPGNDREGTWGEPDEALKALRALRLVTVEMHAPVRVACRDENWRGVAEAMIEAPTRLLFGVDLSGLSRSSLSFGDHGLVLVTIPRPSLQAIELDMSRPREEVTVSGLRLRSRSGVSQLSRARLEIYEAAQRLALTSETERLVAETTLAQVAALFRDTLGEKRSVIVQYPLTLAATKP